MGGRRDGGGGFSVDRLLLPRVEQYGHNNSLSDVSTVADHLRACYPEYQRKQLGPFRKMVANAVRLVRERQRAAADEEEEIGEGPRRRAEAEEARLESRESEHLRRRGLVIDVSDSEASEKCDGVGAVSSSQKRGNKVVRRISDSSSQEEESELDKARPAFNLLNSSLMATYNSRPALVIQSPTFNGTSVFGNLQLEQQQQQQQQEEKSSAAARPRRNSAAYASPITPGEAISSKRSSRTPKAPMSVENTGSESARKRDRENAKALKVESAKKSKSVWEKDPKDAADDWLRNPYPYAKRMASHPGKSSTNVSLQDVGGLDKIKNDVGDFVASVKFSSIYSSLGVENVKALLLHGPPGCGKTMLAEAIANEAGVPFLRISAPEIVSVTSALPEAKLRSLFSDAKRIAPSVIFIDEIDSISTKRESVLRETERRIVTQLMTCMDELDQPSKLPDDENETNNADNKSLCVLLIGATNRPDTLDQALRRRFDREICLGIPDQSTRRQILKALTSKLRVEGDFDLESLARRTPGYAGSDLKALTKEAGLAAVKRIVKSATIEEDGVPWWRSSCSPNELQDVSIKMEDFEEGIRRVQPSTKREGFTEIPTVTFEDVGSLESVREELDLFICRRFKHPDDYEALGFTGSGFLLYGPPGCGKTLIAKAVANAAGVNFIYVKAGELFNKYVGESERAVRQLFSRARACAPCIIFFDEVDALVPSRGNEANAATDRVVNQLLVEMDNLEQHGIFLLAATNRPNMIDKALLRPGRLGKHIYVPLPDAAGRVSILKALLRRMPAAPDVDILQIAEHDLCKDFTGADLHGLVQEACAVALRERVLLKEITGKIALTQKHFMEALSKVKPSVSAKDYEKDFSAAEQQAEKSARKKFLRTVAACSRG